jgi:hypothetical protein
LRPSLVCRPARLHRCAVPASLEVQPGHPWPGVRCYRSSPMPRVRRRESPQDFRDNFARSEIGRALARPVRGARQGMARIKTPPHPLGHLSETVFRPIRDRVPNRGRQG